MIPALTEFGTVQLHAAGLSPAQVEQIGHNALALSHSVQYPNQ